MTREKYLVIGGGRSPGRVDHHAWDRASHSRSGAASRRDAERCPELELRIGQGAVWPHDHARREAIELWQLIGDFKPRRFRAGEYMESRPNRGIIVERSHREPEGCGIVVKQADQGGTANLAKGA